MVNTQKPVPKAPIPEPHDASPLIAEIEVMLDQLAHYQIRERLKAFRQGVEAKDGQPYRLWKSCPVPALEALKRKLAKEIEAFQPKPLPSEPKSSNDDFF